jgi:hypothetical protein
MEKGITDWNYYIKKIINDKREAFKKFISTGKIEDKMDCSHKRAVSKGEVHKYNTNSWEIFVSYRCNKTPTTPSVFLNETKC